MATGYSNTEGQQLLDVAPIESDYYKLLQVEKNASKAEIKVAYHKMSRMYHPDKTQDSKTEEMMKRLNEAKSVLLDEVQRAEYDEKHEDETIYDPKGFLPTGIRFSDFFLKDFNKFKADFKAGKIQVPRQKFERLLQRKVGDALRKAEIYKNDKIRQIAKSNTPTPLLNILQASNALLEEDPNVIANAYKIQQMLLGIQSNGVYSAPPSEDGIKNALLHQICDTA
uniref:J domain-containing protein n=1 Tax=Amphimedon queenslandica TaxID=400682 RepID=A0A1X7SYZ7_AMPQE